MAMSANAVKAVSTTAMAVSLIRSVHSHHAPDPLLHDAWSDVFVSSSMRKQVRRVLLPEMQRLGSASMDDYLQHHPSYAAIVMRERFTEDALFRTLDEDIMQYVLLGAGFDAFAWRYPSMMERLNLFEVDLPDTQQYKQERLETSGIRTPSNLHFVAADFTQSNLRQSLVSGGFNLDKKAFFSWLGVTLYLPRDVNIEMFRQFSNLAPAGGYLAFSYIDDCLLTGAEAGSAKWKAYQRVRAEVERAGEPWVCGFNPDTLPDLLEECGLTLLEDLDGYDLLERFGDGGDQCMLPAPFSRVALAKINPLH
ncbi:Putative S-adenosyl-L-methionine-dependent methyltransferase [BD1-7 clade bacterium]|uniref:S-adenosyl-L-methionine-dependent methyltransferase n=1 Tax=BD1-7 clade bacterium TaxID=2029982 RepID=A0A5S9NL77_9GAMM|nr:Putative S-adenosyl-L-methionine-dependent methyltransferase [BD1-7 clade bacterium]CAA0093555.1 Putative S-adenosyl-L-methionine-dependent methyltransferase [BD1-7 clade bacterium]